MRFVYPAVFSPQKNGTWTGTFPDLAGCTVTGDTLDEAIDRAIEAEYDWLSVELFEEEDGVLPAHSVPEDLRLRKTDIVRDISVNIRFHVGWDE